MGDRPNALTRKCFWIAASFAAMVFSAFFDSASASPHSTNAPRNQAHSLERLDLTASCTHLLQIIEAQGPSLSGWYLSTHWFSAYRDFTLETYLEGIAYLSDRNPQIGIRHSIDRVSLGTIERALNYRRGTREIDCQGVEWPLRADRQAFSEIRSNAVRDRRIRMMLPPSNALHLPRSTNLTVYQDDLDVGFSLLEPLQLAVDPDGQHAIEIGYGGNTIIYQRVGDRWESIALITFVIRH